jgi:UDP-N-acetyl-D-galactosamine dehydrogenase
MLEEYDLNLQAGPTGKYDALVLATPHQEYKNLTLEDMKALVVDTGLIADLKGVWRGKTGDLAYWSL